MILHVLLVLFLSSFLSIQNGVVARKWNLSKREDLQLERQLKRLNKPSVKTIVTEHGDVYDCVYFYQQPAFDHPRLKNHTYHFEKETTFLHNATQDQNLSKLIQNFGLKDEECPIGTVILKRVTKEDLLRKRLIYNRKSRTDGHNYLSVKTCTARTLFTLDTYTGAAAHIGIYNPPVTGNQYSAARVLIQRGLDIIQVGWRVDPILFGDGHSHIFIHTDASGSDSHCFGTDCPAFVVTSRVVSVNSYFHDTVSEKGGENYFFPIDISRDKDTGNWKLRIGHDDKVELGYWPKEIFSDDGLKDLASSIEWGAEVFAPPDFPNTVMGYGNKPTKDTQETAYIQKISYQNPNYETKDTETELFSDDEKYNMIDFIYTDDYFGHTLYYGGPILE